MGKALYRKYRSRSLDDIAGQEHVTRTLKRALEKNAISHAYLLTGPRGVGKTSIARILAHEINKLPYDEDSSHLDIIEIDAASNNGVDDIRDLREKVSLAPTSAEKKIYIIDEVHMLSKPAFNALLKTLEEPPEHAVFILATTDLDKVPETIVSRTQRYTFRRASPESITQLLSDIAKKESIKIEQAALELIAEHSDGSFRDSVSLLDQLSHISTNTISRSDVESMLGLAPDARIKVLLEHVQQAEFDATIREIKSLRAEGFQASVIADQILAILETNPHQSRTLLQLVPELILVAGSRLPDTLLLSILARHTNKAADETSAKPRSAAATVATKPHLLPDDNLGALARKATEPRPADDIVTPNKSQTNKSNSEEKLLDWKAIFSDVSDLSIGLRTVISKCSFVAHSNGEITVYTRGEFYKKKLDTPKYKQELSTYLHAKTNQEWGLVFIPSLPPSKNQTIANVAAMMGGGEEVEV